MIVSIWWKLQQESSKWRADNMFALVKFRKLIFICFFTVLLISITHAVFANDTTLSKKVQFDISQQRADTALIEFAKQANITLFFPFTESKGVTANALHGEYTIERGIQLLLSNTQLKVEVGEGDQLTILADASLGGVDSMFNKNRLSGAVIGVMASVAASQATAQEVNAANNEVLEEVIITGSFLKRSSFDGTAPLQVMDREFIEATPVTSISDIVRNLPVSTGAQTSSELDSQVGTANINIRGLGAGSTLTLINGRRSGNSTAPDINSNLYFDINQLPLAMIERIEILTDGASATYGAQAVAGVANIITRKGFEGFEIKLSGESSLSDRRGLDIAAGTRGDNSIFNIYLSASQQDRIERGELDWYKGRLGTDLVSGTGAPGSYTRNVAGGERLPDAFCGMGGDGNETIGDSNYTNELGYLSGNTCRFSFFDQISALPESNLLQMFSEFEWDISDQLTFYGEVGASHNVLKSTFGSSLFSAAPLVVPGDHPYNFYVANGATGLEYRGPDSNGNFAAGDEALWANGTLQGVELVATTRLLGQETQAYGSQYGTGKPGEARYVLDYQRIVLGADVEIVDGWDAGFSYVRSLASNTEEVPYEWVPDNVLNALLTGTFNPFGTALLTPNLVSPKQGVPGDVRAANSSIVTDSLWDMRNNFRRTDTAVFEAIVTGELFEMEGGSAGLAVGAQTRKESYRSNLDSLRSTGSSGRNIEEPAINGGESSTAVFAELYLPLFDAFEMQLAARYEDFDVANVDTTVPKISARWQATDWLALRASWGESFQAPGIFQTATVVSSSILADSVYLGSGGCSPSGPSDSQPSQITNIILRGADDLEPQTAENFNFGLVFDLTENLRLGVEYWSYDYTDLITQGITAQTKINNDCLDGIPNDPDIIRAASTVPGGVGILRTVETEIINVGSVKNDGVDLSFDYIMDTDVGSWNFAGTLSYVSSFDIVEGLAGRKIDGVGSRNSTNSFRTVPEWKGRLNFGWALENQRANVTLNYIDGYKNDGTITASFPNPSSVDAMMTVDLQYSYIMQGLIGDSESVLTLGARNLFDEDPPFLGPNLPQTTPSQRPGYDEFAHDPRGRAYTVSFTQKF